LALAEIRFGIELREPGKRRSDLQRWFELELLVFFSNRSLPVTRAVADRRAVLAAQQQKAGKTIPTIDGLIGATALERDFGVVTP
jgi:predicted nucleic acid-binding protein